MNPLPQFTIHQRITVKKERINGYIDFIHSFDGITQAYDVRKDDGVTSTYNEHEITEEKIIQSPFDLLENNLFSNYQISEHKPDTAGRTYLNIFRLSNWMHLS